MFDLEWFYHASKSGLSSYVRFAGAFASGVPWRGFLSLCMAARKRIGPRRHGVAPLQTNFPHGPPDRKLLPSVLPFTTSRVATPGELPSPKRVGSRRTLPQPAHPRAFSALPYGPSLLGSCTPRVTHCRRRDVVGLSSVNVVSHFVQVIPSQTPMRLASRNRVSTNERVELDPQGFSNVRSLARRTCRIAAPPGLSLPGPFNAPCYQATLAAYPLRLLGGATASLHCLWRGSSKDFRTGSDLHG